MRNKSRWSENKWLILGYIAAIFNPAPTGIIAGLILRSEKKYEKHGYIVIIVSIVLLALTVLLINYGSVV